MIAQKFEYTAPKSLDEALHLLASGAKPLAGGMSLIPMMKLRLAAPEHPAADYPAALQALEAKFVIKGAKAERTMSAADFFVDAFTTALEPGEILREVIVPIDDARTGTSYQKMVQPASGFAIVGVAARVRVNAGKISFVRIGVTGLSNRAFRAASRHSKRRSACCPRC